MLFEPRNNSTNASSNGAPSQRNLQEASMSSTGIPPPTLTNPNSENIQQYNAISPQVYHRPQFHSYPQMTTPSTMQNPSFNEVVTTPLHQSSQPQPQLHHPQNLPYTTQFSSKMNQMPAQGYNTPQTIAAFSYQQPLPEQAAQPIKLHFPSHFTNVDMEKTISINPSAPMNSRNRANPQPGPDLQPRTLGRSNFNKVSSLDSQLSLLPWDANQIPSNAALYVNPYVVTPINASTETVIFSSEPKQYSSQPVSQNSQGSNPPNPENSTNASISVLSYNNTMAGSGGQHSGTDFTTSFARDMPSPYKMRSLASTTFEFFDNSQLSSTTLTSKYARPSRFGAANTSEVEPKHLKNGLKCDGEHQESHYYNITSPPNDLTRQMQNSQVTPLWKSWKAIQENENEKLQVIPGIETPIQQNSLVSDSGTVQKLPLYQSGQIQPDAFKDYYSQQLYSQPTIESGRSGNSSTTLTMSNFGSSEPLSSHPLSSHPPPTLASLNPNDVNYTWYGVVPPSNHLAVSMSTNQSLTSPSHIPTPLPSSNPVSLSTMPSLASASASFPSTRTTPKASRLRVLTVPEVVEYKNIFHATVRALLQRLTCKMATEGKDNRIDSSSDTVSSTNAAQLSGGILPASVLPHITENLGYFYSRDFLATLYSLLFRSKAEAGARGVLSPTKTSLNVSPFTDTLLRGLDVDDFVLYMQTLITLHEGVQNRANIEFFKLTGRTLTSKIKTGVDKGNEFGVGITTSQIQPSKGLFEYMSLEVSIDKEGKLDFTRMIAELQAAVDDEIKEQMKCGGEYERVWTLVDVRNENEKENNTEDKKRKEDGITKVVSKESELGGALDVTSSNPAFALSSADAVNLSRHTETLKHVHVDDYTRWLELKDTERRNPGLLNQARAALEEHSREIDDKASASLPQTKLDEKGTENVGEHKRAVFNPTLSIEKNMDVVGSPYNYYTNYTQTLANFAMGKESDLLNKSPSTSLSLYSAVFLPSQNSVCAVQNLSSTLSSSVNEYDSAKTPIYSFPDHRKDENTLETSFLRLVGEDMGYLYSVYQHANSHIGSGRLSIPDTSSVGNNNVNIDAAGVSTTVDTNTDATSFPILPHAKPVITLQDAYVVYSALGFLCTYEDVYSIVCVVLFAQQKARSFYLPTQAETATHQFHRSLPSKTTSLDMSNAPSLGSIFEPTLPTHPGTSGIDETSTLPEAFWETTKYYQTNPRPDLIFSFDLFYVVLKQLQYVYFSSFRLQHANKIGLDISGRGASSANIYIETYEARESLEQSVNENHFLGLLERTFRAIASARARDERRKMVLSETSSENSTFGEDLGHVRFSPHVISKTEMEFSLRSLTGLVTSKHKTEQGLPQAMETSSYSCLPRLCFSEADLCLFLLLCFPDSDDEEDDDEEDDGNDDEHDDEHDEDNGNDDNNHDNKRNENAYDEDDTYEHNSEEWCSSEYGNISEIMHMLLSIAHERTIPVFSSSASNVVVANESLFSMPISLHTACLLLSKLHFVLSPSFLALFEMYSETTKFSRASTTSHVPITPPTLLSVSIAQNTGCVSLSLASKLWPRIHTSGLHFENLSIDPFTGALVPAYSYHSLLYSSLGVVPPPSKKSVPSDVEIFPLVESENIIKRFQEGTITEELFQEEKTTMLSDLLSNAVPTLKSPGELEVPMAFEVTLLRAVNIPIEKSGLSRLQSHGSGLSNQYNTNPRGYYIRMSLNSSIPSSTLTSATSCLVSNIHTALPSSIMEDLKTPALDSYFLRHDAGVSFSQWSFATPDYAKSGKVGEGETNDEGIIGTTSLENGTVFGTNNTSGQVAFHSNLDHLTLRFEVSCRKTCPADVPPSHPDAGLVVESEISLGWGEICVSKRDLFLRALASSSSSTSLKPYVLRVPLFLPTRHATTHSANGHVGMDTLPSDSKTPLLDPFTLRKAPRRRSIFSHLKAKLGFSSDSRDTDTLRKIHVNKSDRVDSFGRRKHSEYPFMTHYTPSATMAAGEIAEEGTTQKSSTSNPIDSCERIAHPLFSPLATCCDDEAFLEIVISPMHLATAGKRVAQLLHVLPYNTLVPSASIRVCRLGLELVVGNLLGQYTSSSIAFLNPLQERNGSRKSQNQQEDENTVMERDFFSSSSASLAMSASTSVTDSTTMSNLTNALVRVRTDSLAQAFFFCLSRPVLLQVLTEAYEIQRQTMYDVERRDEPSGRPNPLVMQSFVSILSRFVPFLAPSLGSTFSDFLLLSSGFQSSHRHPVVFRKSHSFDYVTSYNQEYALAKDRTRYSFDAFTGLASAASLYSWIQGPGSLATEQEASLMTSTVSGFSRRNLHLAEAMEKYNAHLGTGRWFSDTFYDSALVSFSQSVDDIIKPHNDEHRDGFLFDSSLLSIYSLDRGQNDISPLRSIFTSADMKALRQISQSEQIDQASHMLAVVKTDTSVNIGAGGTIAYVASGEGGQEQTFVRGTQGDSGWESTAVRKAFGISTMTRQLNPSASKGSISASGILEEAQIPKKYAQFHAPFSIEEVIFPSTF